jgi:hypothetical protein
MEGYFQEFQDFTIYPAQRPGFPEKLPYTGATTAPAVHGEFVDFPNYVDFWVDLWYSAQMWRFCADAQTEVDFYKCSWSGLLFAVGALL